jgi:hypothetical protein
VTSSQAEKSMATRQLELHSILQTYICHELIETAEAIEFRATCVVQALEIEHKSSLIEAKEHELVKANEESEIRGQRLSIYETEISRHRKNEGYLINMRVELERAQSDLLRYEELRVQAESVQEKYVGHIAALNQHISTVQGEFNELTMRSKSEAEKLKSLLTSREIEVNRLLNVLKEQNIREDQYQKSLEESNHQSDLLRTLLAEQTLKTETTEQELNKTRENLTSSQSNFHRLRQHASTFLDYLSMYHSIYQIGKSGLPKIYNFRVVVLTASGHVTEYEAIGNYLRIGRSPFNSLAFEDDRMDDFHTRVYVQKKKLILEDLNSHHGTFIDGVRLTKPIEITSLSTIKIGDLRMRFSRSIS